AEKQIKEDMKITHEMIGDEFAIPVIFFERPKWDTFPGAVRTHAADALTDSGKVIQLPSTHLLGTNFSKPFDVSFIDKNGEKKYGYITCYGPSISRIYGAMVAIHGDDVGLVLPFDLAPVQVVIVPILFEDSKDKVLLECSKIEKMLSGKYIVRLDARDDKSPGEKFNEWEMKGVPVRIEVGPKDVDKKQAVVVTRHDSKKSAVKVSGIEKAVADIAKRFTRELKDRQMKNFTEKIIDCKTMPELEKAISGNNIVRCGFCSMELSGEACADIIKDKTGAEVRGKKVDKEEKKFSKCVVCGKPAKVTVYVAKSY
ncbi:MAG: proline--tRNA ligase, partial [Candidatus Aenigmarchaeota archaeon]|nr:proline--tRNA ligase [Candidatus Aenigmarchaeota archaeon]